MTERDEVDLEILEEFDEFPIFPTRYKASVVATVLFLLTSYFIFYSIHLECFFSGVLFFLILNTIVICGAFKGSVPVLWITETICAVAFFFNAVCCLVCTVHFCHLVYKSPNEPVLGVERHPVLVIDIINVAGAWDVLNFGLIFLWNFSVAFLNYSIIHLFRHVVEHFDAIESMV
ncbi:Protein CBG27223 [Caenorhabditis briggsae]|uniref:Protein CBG27223 n=1 Tax=Caenorhabditis briggsae TaxID=6238 RepID=B6IFU6_CAEBR|nr:Protein CBG27223 [Caenorhabditis briggsae]CAR98762.1 Protein CBG27223 [Caenorhabditis briggsae]